MCGEELLKLRVIGVECGAPKAVALEAHARVNHHSPCSSVEPHAGVLSSKNVESRLLHALERSTIGAWNLCWICDGLQSVISAKLCELCDSPTHLVCTQSTWVLRLKSGLGRIGDIARIPIKISDIRDNEPPGCTCTLTRTPNSSPGLNIEIAIPAQMACLVSKAVTCEPSTDGENEKLSMTCICHDGDWISIINSQDFTGCTV